MDAVSLRVLPSRVANTANFADVVLREFGQMDSFASSSGSMPYLILNIGLPGVPAEICGHIVRTIAVIVAALHSIGTRADKGFKNKDATSSDPVAAMAATNEIE